jgi:SAM-dependent methyltransferase
MSSPAIALLERVLGIPFVFKHIRPLVIGGLDMSQVFDKLDVRETDTVLDVGCGSGVALEHLPPFANYFGFDTDARAISVARAKAATRKEYAVLEAREVTAEDVRAAQPDIGVLSGLLHHLDDQACVSLLRSLCASAKLRQVVTFDVSFFPHEYFSNVLTVLDRGQYGRRPEGYTSLAEQGGFDVALAAKLPAKRSGSRVHFWLMVLTPKPS